MFAEADAFAPGLVLASPGTVEVSVVATIAGRVPVITAGDRTDFVALVQAFTERNEPTPLPSSMGACLVAGFNNWDRIAAYRTAWERARPEGSIGETWAEAFERLVPQKPLYQDRFVILSRGPYSGVGAERTGFDDEAWLDRSLIIRREHECTHYFVYRLTGMLPRSVMDELVADFVGLVRACGGYRTDLALRFLGLDAYPPYRPGGRLENYRGTLGIGTAAFEDVARLTASAVQQLAEVAAFFHHDLQALDGLARLAFALSRLSLDECARPGLPERLARPSIPA